MLATFLAITQILTSYSAWSLAALEADVNQKLAQLDASVDKTTHTLDVKDIKYVFSQSGCHHAMIIYEINNRVDDRIDDRIDTLDQKEID